MSMADLRRLLGFVLASTVVDEGWYLSQYPDVGDETSPDRPEKYADYHFRMHGYLEGRLPADPQLDEAWYLQQYPDVAHAIDMGEIPDALTHFVRSGYKEDRWPNPESAMAGFVQPVPV